MLATADSLPARKDTGLHIQVVVLFASMFSLLVSGAIAPALPGMKEYFAATPNVDTLVKLQLSLTALFIAIGAPIAGLLIDRVGRRPVMAVSVLLTGIFGAAGYFADSLAWLLGTRVVLGLGAGGVVTAATTLVGDFFQGERRSRFVGRQSAAMKIGGIVFTLIGGILATISWRTVFLIDLLALLILPSIFVVVPNERSPSRAPSAAGGARPDYAVWALASLAAFLGQVLFYMVPTQVPFLVKSLGAASPALISYVISATVLASAISASQFHRFKNALSYAAIAGLAFVVMGIGYAMVMIASSVSILFGALIVSGLGLGLMVPTTTAWLLAFTPEYLRGRGVGFLMTATFIGQFASPLLFAPVLARVGISQLFVIAGGISIGIGLVFAVIAMVRKDGAVR